MAALFLRTVVPLSWFVRPTCPLHRLFVRSVSGYSFVGSSSGCAVGVFIVVIPASGSVIVVAAWVDCVAVAVGAEGSGFVASFAVPVCVGCTAACSDAVGMRTSAVAEADVSVVSASAAVLPSVTSILSPSIPSWMA